MNLEKGGGWNTVYQQEKGISTVRKLLYLRPDWFVDSDMTASSTTCVLVP